MENNQTTEVATLELFNCEVPRRGKGAKGTLPIQTIGKPVVDDDGITRSWTYDHLKDTDYDAVKSITDSLDSAVILLASAYDTGIRSETGASQNKVNILAARILSEKMAEDKDSAKKMAAEFYQTVTLMAKVGREYSIDDCINDKKKVLARMKNAGTKLVDNRKK